MLEPFHLILCNQGYLKAAPMITGAMETYCPVHTPVSNRHGPSQVEEGALVASLRSLLEEGEERWQREWKGAFCHLPQLPSTCLI